MGTTDQPLNEPEQPKVWFTTTHWSVVLAAGDEGGPATGHALDVLCRTYWHPLYAYVRRCGHDPVDAQDLTQDFFARFLEKNYVRNADPEKGRFRTKDQGFPSWAHPVVSGGRLYIRDQGTLSVYNIKAR